jgi:hypothetical protein
MYDSAVSGHERDVRRARAGYLGAVRELARAMAEFERVDVPMLPGADGRIAVWSDEQEAVMDGCALAWPAVVDRHREYRSALRTAGHPETWPHA